MGKMKRKYCVLFKKTVKLKLSLFIVLVMLANIVNAAIIKGTDYVPQIKIDSTEVNKVWKIHKLMNKPFEIIKKMIEEEFGRTEGTEGSEEGILYIMKSGKKEVKKGMGENIFGLGRDTRMMSAKDMIKSEQVICVIGNDIYKSRDSGGKGIAIAIGIIIMLIMRVLPRGIPDEVNKVTNKKIIKYAVPSLS
ncbi:MAG: hypothetical protein LBD46_07775 [Endomicrobium sp.]|jgi:hypothetical protein|nr:hypothetical protein [Endomicrobium sp.]